METIDSPFGSEEQESFPLCSAALNKKVSLIFKRRLLNLNFILKKMLCMCVCYVCVSANHPYSQPEG